MSVSFGFGREDDLGAEPVASFTGTGAVDDLERSADQPALYVELDLDRDSLARAALLVVLLFILGRR